MPTQVENMEDLIGNLLPQSEGAEYVSYLKDLLDSIKHENSSRLSYLRAIASRVKKEEFSIEESIDIGFLLRECEKYLDEMRKDFKAHKEMIGKVTCYKLSVEEKESCRGSLATGTLKAKYSSKLPHPVRESERFIKLCEFFGIDTNKIPLGMVRFHWPTVKKHVTHCMEMGEELPNELSDVSVELEIVYRSSTNGKGE